jgi:methyl-accepting chemotaxis protein
LALNAAIEAARAGEQGRGFAVVADEVRNLAKKTADATKEVGDVIKEIQDNTRNVSDKMSTSTESANLSVELAGKANQALDQILEQSNEVAIMVESIALSSNLQATDINKISEDIKSIDSLATVSSNAVEQSAEIAQGLNKSAHELSDQISIFKT